MSAETLLKPPRQWFDSLIRRLRQPQRRLGTAPTSEPHGEIPETISLSPVTALPAVRAWGWFPHLAVVSCLGLLLIITAYTAARFDEPTWLLEVYWGGFALMVGPVIMRLIMPQPERSERLALLMLLMMNVYLFKALLSPNYIYLGDEFVHYRSSVEIIMRGQLFNPNPILPASAYYPGLQNVIVTLATISGLSVYHASLLIIIGKQIILMTSLFLMYEYISKSHWIAGLASVFYMSNPNYVFYGQQFGYESMSLPLMALGMYFLARRAIVVEKPDAKIGDYGILIFFLISAIVPTHHMTSYAFIGFLLIWTLGVFAERRGWLNIGDFIVARLEALLHWLAKRLPFLRPIFNQFSLLDYRSKVDYPASTTNKHTPNTSIFLIFAIAITLLWLFEIATITVGYLSPVLGGALRELVKLIAGEIGAKETFRTIVGPQPPLWERFVAFGAVGLICVGLPFGWVQAWRQYRNIIPVLALIGWSMIYYITLAMRMTKAGTEAANRSSEFLFIGIGFMLAVFIVELILKRGLNGPRLVMVTIYMMIIFMGGIITGQAWWARLPGTYVVGGDSRTIQPESYEASVWAYTTYPGHNNRMISDGINRKLLGSYGFEFPVRGASWVVFSNGVGPREQRVFYNQNMQFIALDYRLTTMLPINGHYLESGEPGAGRHTAPLDPSKINKFDQAEGVSRFFHSGNMRMFDVSAYSRARRGDNPP